MRTVGRIFWSLVLAALAVAVLAMHPWASDNSIRQARLMAPSQRVQNFRSMDEVFPSHVIRKSARPYKFEREERPLPATYSFGGQEKSVEDFLKRTMTEGLMVVQGNTIRVERYGLGVTAHTPVTSWSVAKSITSLLVGIALDEGKLRKLDTPLSQYAPALAGRPFGQVTLEQALTMTSGIEFTEKYDDMFSDIYRVFGHLFFLHQPMSSYLATRQARAAPGSTYYYSSADTLALGFALRGAVGKSMASYLEEKVWGPLGAQYDATWNIERGSDEAELAFCCFNARLTDLAKLGRLVGRKGDWDGRRIVSEEWIHQSTMPAPDREPGKIPHTNWGYGYLWWTPASGRGAVMAVGVYSQYIYVNPKREIVIVKNSVDPDAHDYDEHVALFEAIEDSL